LHFGDKAMNKKYSNRREFLKNIGISVLSLAIPNVVKATSKNNAADKPNIIFFIADDMSYDMFNFLNNSKEKKLTPHLDQLAVEGTIMMRQYISSPVCTPSRYSCLTGKYASRAQNEEFLASKKIDEGMKPIGWNTHIVPSDVTLPKLMKKAGYVTGAVGKNHVIQAEEKKFAPNADPKDPVIQKDLKEQERKIRNAYLSCGFDYAESLFQRNADALTPTVLAVHNMDWVVKGALDFLEQNKNKTFFLYFASTLTHSPSGKGTSWDADPLKTPFGYLEKTLDVLPARHTIKGRLKKANIQFTDKNADLLWLDDCLGVLIQKLKEIGQYDNTIIFFFNDNGISAKSSIYEGGVWAPSIVWKKGGFPCGKKSETCVSNIDFVPTILDLAGAQVTGNLFDGNSFKPFLMGETTKIHDSIYFELGYSRGVVKENFKYIALRYPAKAEKWSVEQRQKVLIKENELKKIQGKAIFNEEPKAPFGHLNLVPGGKMPLENLVRQKYPHYSNKDQLYDLSTDPDEQRNLATNPTYAEKLKEMQEELKKYLRQLPGKFGELKPNEL
jgi:arylsulfatase A-like enzyme